MRHILHSITIAFLWAASIVAFTPDLACCDPADAKAPSPDAAAQKAALALVQDVYKDDIAKAKKSEEKAVLSRKLLQAGVDEKKDIAARFVLFMMARDIAGETGDLEDACKAVDEMDSAYQIDALKMKSDAATVAAKGLHTADDRKKFAGAVDPLIERAVLDDRYDIAKQLNDLSLTAARLSHDSDLLKQAVSRTQQIKDGQTTYAEVKAATAVLDQKPTDSDANLKVGKYKCFVKGDWDNGIPMLSLGSDVVLKGLAEKELAGAKTADEQIKLGDAWWDFAEKLSGTSKSQAQARASKWYQQGLPNIESALLKAKIEKRMKDSTRITLVQGFHRPVNVLKMIDTQRDAVSEARWTFTAGALLAPKRNEKGWHGLKLPYIPKGDYDIAIKFIRMTGDDGPEFYLKRANRAVGWVHFGNDLQTNANLNADHGSTPLTRTREPYERIRNNISYIFVAKVRADGVVISLNGVNLIDHKQDFSSARDLVNDPKIMLGAGEVRFEAMEIIDLEK